jgi:hypothetical protein
VRAASENDHSASDAMAGELADARRELEVIYVTTNPERTTS